MNAYFTHTLVLCNNILEIYFLLIALSSLLTSVPTGAVISRGIMVLISKYIKDMLHFNFGLIG